MIPRTFRSLSRTSGTPVFSILVIATLCSTTPGFGRAALSWLVDMTSAGITIPYFFASSSSSPSPPSGSGRRRRWLPPPD
ncbi:hypothetical protein [Micrococcus sp. FDAARGOS_333]|uniref:hypothetical protein n=1 Tax=Micrococcus sp. FDAARGOS_333 TaxID=1930558 RepID=UPI00350F642D